ncbi:low quality protein: olfactory [Lynx pardinus]|uniref:Low quality protein: olfactory n=1 Tax=Lynx pardinus TaxID=191816 RepID=A0A485MZ84_LYNPA|nr:low quality protein: olfactory [Lynx pardinus]
MERSSVPTCALPVLPLKRRTWQQLQVYTVVTPMLSPFIYRLRNKDMKGALKRLLTQMQIVSSHMPHLST